MDRLHARATGASLQCRRRRHRPGTSSTPRRCLPRPLCTHSRLRRSCCLILVSPLAGLSRASHRGDATIPLLFRGNHRQDVRVVGAAADRCDCRPMLGAAASSAGALRHGERGQWGSATVVADVGTAAAAATAAVIFFSRHRGPAGLGVSLRTLGCRFSAEQVVGSVCLGGYGARVVARSPSSRCASAPPAAFIGQSD